MRIIADENIPGVEQAFSTLGDVTLVPGRELRGADVRDADILLVRSVTRVGPALLEGSRVRFVGSATIGFDHVDRNYLQACGIGFATAPGSNATSAAEYVLSALLALAARDGFRLQDLTVGIVGCGNVGSRVQRMLAVLGCDCRVNDPPLQARGGHDEYVALDSLLDTDILTLHVPLSRAGDYPTFHLIDAAFLERLKPGAMLINTARGAVIDNPALERLLGARPDVSVVLDVWEGEPAISIALLEKVALGTAHIAGYSQDGKLRGTGMIYRAACEYFGQPADWQAERLLPEPAPLNLTIPPGEDPQTSLGKVVHSCYDVRVDDARLRGLLDLEPGQRPGYFDRLRKEYPVRREFSSTTLLLDGADERLRAMLQGIGFTCR
ncbi:MAG: 4-phosphoerythronate dehydrogenase PdxB [Gammaproteobacteria bacterium]|jgi:erythronate-4-phosphate dehydrogenase